jgi:hypothetical protein
LNRAGVEPGVGDRQRGIGRARGPECLLSHKVAVGVGRHVAFGVSDRSEVVLHVVGVASDRLSVTSNLVAMAEGIRTSSDLWMTVEQLSTALG